MGAGALPVVCIYILIQVRDMTKGGVDQPQFDYNTGQFTLQPMPAQAEEVFKVVFTLTACL